MSRKIKVWVVSTQCDTIANEGFEFFICSTEKKAERVKRKLERENEKTKRCECGAKTKLKPKEQCEECGDFDIRNRNDEIRITEYEYEISKRGIMEAMEHFLDHA